ncbi:hypothetical protein, partial [Yersinia pestis]|uniref:hypothetical protein n=1 Tax=Yersinia pestis TaxID=632 RepID=UPI001C1E24DB
LWRGRFTLLPILTVQDRVIGVCQQSACCYLIICYLKMIIFQLAAYSVLFSLSVLPSRLR